MTFLMKLASADVNTNLHSQGLVVRRVQRSLSLISFGHSLLGVRSTMGPLEAEKETDPMEGSHVADGPNRRHSHPES